MCIYNPSPQGAEAGCRVLCCVGYRVHADQWKTQGHSRMIFTLWGHRDSGSGRLTIALQKAFSLLYSLHLSKSISTHQNLYGKLRKGDKCQSNSQPEPLGVLQPSFAYFKQKVVDTKGSSHKRQIKVQVLNTPESNQLQSCVELLLQF